MAGHLRDPRREAFWRGVLRRFHGSGLSVRAFCQRERLTESAFFAWRRTILQRDGKNTPPARSRPRKAPAFVPAVVTSESRRQDSITIELMAGRVLRLPESISAARLAELVEALEARTLEARSLQAQALVAEAAR